MADNERRSCHGENNKEEEARGSGGQVKEREISGGGGRNFLPPPSYAGTREHAKRGVNLSS